MTNAEPMLSIGCARCSASSSSWLDEQFAKTHMMIRRICVLQCDALTCAVHLGQLVLAHGWTELLALRYGLRLMK